MLTLLYVFSIIAITTVGGGYAMIPLIQQEAITIHQWITETEFVNILAVSQVTPGAIAINSATFIGFKNYHILGAIIASVGFVLPSFIIIFLIAPILKKYEKNRIRINIFNGIRPIVTGLIGAAIIVLAKKIFIIQNNISYISIFITTISFVILRFFKIKPVYTLLLCAISGVIILP